MKIVFSEETMSNQSVLETAAPVSIPEKVTEEWLAGLSDKQLLSVLNAARAAYHNTTKNRRPLMSDRLFDFAEKLFYSKRPTDPYWDKVGAPVANKRQKVRLSVPMGSLGKIKTTEEINAFLNGENTAEISDKLDGLSCQIDMTTKGKMKAFKRGSGTMGEEITAILPHVNGIGNIIPGWVIRGELCVSKKGFKKHGAGYENERNMASGIANSLKEISKSAGALDLVIHSVQRPDMPLAKAAAKLKAAGWKVVFRLPVKGKIAQKLPVLLTARNTASPYVIDGLVVTTAHGVISFKGIDNTAIGEVSHVEWNVSRHTMINPVVVLKKGVRLDGVTVTRMSVHNAKAVVSLGLGPGALIEVKRSGKVIPQVHKVLKKVKPQLPTHVKWKWNATNTDILLDDKTATDILAGVKLSKLTHFVMKLGIEGVKGGLLGRLVDAGIDTPAKLYKADAAAYQKAGLGPSQATQFRGDLLKAIPVTPLPAMLEGSGYFPRGWGETRFTSLLDHISYTRLVGLVDKKNQLTQAISTVPGLGEKTAEGFGPALKKFIKLAEKIGYKPVSKRKNPVKGPLFGKTFVLTGFRDAEISRMIEAKGGTMGNRINKDTSYLIVADKNFSSEKTKNAKALGVKIITVQELQKLLK